MSKKITIGGTQIGLSGNTLKTRRELPRISVEGTNFKRLGVNLKLFGFSPQNFYFVDDFYNWTVGGIERTAVETEIQGNRSMGANVMRLYLQMWDFIQGTYGSLSVKIGPMANLLHQVNLARRNDTYLLICGANCWIPTNTPTWYDSETNANRWNVQQYFWEQIVKSIKTSGNASTVLGYDLINEPNISADSDASWYGGTINGISYSPLIARGVTSGNYNSTVQSWITQLKTAIKTIDSQALVTFGALPFTSGAFSYGNTQSLLDFVSPHIYPPNPSFATQDLSTTLGYITGWATSTKPVLVGETLAWSTVPADAVTVMDAIAANLEGAISFSYGYGPDLYTTAPDSVRYPAESDGMVWGLSYAGHKTALELFLTYKNDFIP
jgi:Cellulase (glycosyl hydrolase family 5)